MFRASLAHLQEALHRCLLTYSMEHSASWEADQSSELTKKFPAVYGTQKFFTVLTSARHPSLSWANSIQSPRLPPTSWRSILILSSHLRLGLPNGLFPSGFPTNNLCTPLSSPIRSYNWLGSLIRVFTCQELLFCGVSYISEKPACLLKIFYHRIYAVIRALCFRVFTDTLTPLIASTFFYLYLLRHHFYVPILFLVGRDSAVGIAAGYGLDNPGITSRCRWDFLHHRPAPGITQPLVKCSGLGVGYPLPSSVRFKKEYG
jgi:hypothetical protein